MDNLSTSNYISIVDNINFQLHSILPVIDFPIDTVKSKLFKGTLIKRWTGGPDLISGQCNHPKILTAHNFAFTAMPYS